MSIILLLGFKQMVWLGIGSFVQTFEKNEDGDQKEIRDLLEDEEEASC